MESGTELAGRYRLESPLGHGGAGEVWRGRDLVLDREVAVKVLPAGVPGPGEERQLRREAQSAAGLRHPGITVVFDIGQHGGQMFIVMELLHGHDLARLLNPDLRAQVDQVVDGHRDIYTDNSLHDEVNRMCLADARLFLRSRAHV